MEYNLKEVAGRIKDLREAKGYSPEELAKLTGVSVSDYMLLEEGDTDFSFTFIYKCAKACGVEVVEVPRLEEGGQPISASRVRALLAAGELNAIAPLVPSTTYDYLKNHRQEV